MWQTFPPILKFAFGYSPVMDTSRVSIGGIHFGQLERHTLWNTHMQHTVDEISFFAKSTALNISLYKSFYRQIFPFHSHNQFINGTGD